MCYSQSLTEKKKWNYISDDGVLLISEDVDRVDTAVNVVVVDIAVEEDGVWITVEVNWVDVTDKEITAVIWNVLIDEALDDFFIDSVWTFFQGEYFSYMFRVSQT